MKTLKKGRRLTSVESVNDDTDSQVLLEGRDI